MHVSNTSGLIAAASVKHSKPMLQIGDITILKRIVITMQQVGIFPIVIIAGVDYYEVHYDMFRYGVIFLKMDNPDEPSMLQSVKLGLSYLKGKSERVMITPVNVPMFSPNTLVQMMQQKAGIVKPVYNGKGGHPILISQDLIPEILENDWNDEMREMTRHFSDNTAAVDVSDPGILMNIHNEQELHDHLEQHNHSILHPHLNLTIEKEKSFFDSRIKLLLYLIADTHNVRQSCERMGLSYSKAWNMLNHLEKELGYKVVERSHGGSRGGKTRLTARGVRLLQFYQVYEEDLARYAQQKFWNLFQNIEDEDASL